jgi:hypothetical protein
MSFFGPENSIFKSDPLSSAFGGWGQWGSNGPNHHGAAQMMVLWRTPRVSPEPAQRVEGVFEPHSEEEDLDVEYRVLVNEFMGEALEKVVELGEGQETLEVPSVAPLSNKPLSGHALRKRHS